MMKPTILIDGRIFSLQSHGGVSQQWAQILCSKIFSNAFDIWLMTYRGFEKNIHLKSLLENYPRKINVFECDIPPSDNDNFNNVESRTRRIRLIKSAIPKKPDAVINTYYGENIFPSCRNYVVVAHDYAHEELPSLASKASTPGVLRRKREAFQSAQLIVSVSSNTFRTGLQLYPHLKGTRNVVIYHGHSGYKQNAEIVTNKIVHIGGRGGYKNFDAIYKNIPRILIDAPNSTFFIVGGESIDNDIKTLEIDFPGRVSSHIGISDIEVEDILSTSEFFISASLYEGFGIPLLNSLRLGVTPIISNITVYKELASDSAYYFDPLDHENIYQVIMKAINGGRPRIPAGFMRTWENAAQEYVREIMGMIHA
ncbi:glycosyltransferase [Lacisediminimonas profundi]|uniref:glycosyltransferase n=1 Tax=Lacisediminimonas profundi TaxID=2603856 RepID=UPI001386F4EB|nr:glycosyltransferase [Lacisediminimonas profundi]